MLHKGMAPLLVSAKLSEYSMPIWRGQGECEIGDRHLFSPGISRWMDQRAVEKKVPITSFATQLYRL
jgi:hypothetical protein